MTNNQNGTDELIKKIIDNEMEMFKNVKTYEPSKCQEELKTFRLMRWMSHSVLPEDVLTSYSDDLIKAKKDGRNLMTEKYARMENIIPPLKTNPLIEKIVLIEAEWMKEMNSKFPLTFQNKGDGFSQYFACELETYSDETIVKYYNAAAKAKKENTNLVKERYNNLFKKLGYKSIEDKESELRAIKFKQENEFRGC